MVFVSTLMFVLLGIIAAVIVAMCFVERLLIRKFGVWGIVIPVISCFLGFFNLFFWIGAAIQFIIFIVMFQKQKKQNEMDKMNIQDL